MNLVIKEYRLLGRDAVLSGITVLHYKGSAASIFHASSLLAIGTLVIISVVCHLTVFGRVVFLFVCDPKIELFLQFYDLQFCLLSMFLPVSV
jgi:hypothetical protein